MSDQYDCCSFFRSLCNLFQTIIPIADTYKEVYKNNVVPEIWRASWIYWRNCINNSCKKQYISLFLESFFDFLEINTLYYEDLDDYKINSIVYNRKNYFPSDMHLLIQEIIPKLVYRLSVIMEKIHVRRGVVRTIIYRKYVMNNVYYINEELPLRKYTSNNKDIITGNWVLTNEFYYDYKNPTLGGTSRFPLY